MTIAKLDLVNIGLMLLAMSLAVAGPYEAFLLGYAFIGPLHYLTEISWLHDRKQFSAHRIDAFFLVLPMFLVFLGFGILGTWHSPFFTEISPEIILFTFLSALVYHLQKNVWKRFLWLLGVLGATILFAFSGVARYWLLLYLPTLIHVFVFTGIFILLGALRNRTRTGIVSLCVFVALAVICFANPLVAFTHVPGLWARKNFTFFAPMTSGLCFIFGLHQSNSRELLTPFYNAEEMYASPAALKVTTFIAFAYLYHYFNWFSKTGVIGWHRISKRRALLIVGIWLASAGLYAWNYEVGLVWLALLSLAHVTLEFPLNWLSMKESLYRCGSFVGFGGRGGEA